MSAKKQVRLRPEHSQGMFANAFRVVDAEGDQCHLEFLVYSKTENRARIVGRVSVNKGLLPLLRDAITEVL